MKNIFIFLMMMISFSGISQNITGQAIYESKTHVDMDNIDMGREMREDMKKMLGEQLKSAFEKRYILTFNQEESIYKEEERLDPNSGFNPIQVMGGNFMPGPQYKNLKTRELLEEKEFFGKEFLISDTLPDLDWKIGKESKQIGEYTVFKATAIKKTNFSDFNLAKPKEGVADKSAEELSKEDPMDLIDIPKEIEVTAWFTPQIPVSNGPGEFSGLPGLIMELSMGKTTLLCSKIVLNAKNPDKIERLKKGKKVTQKQYAEIVSEKMKELQENFRNSGGRRGGF